MWLVKTAVQYMRRTNSPASGTYYRLSELRFITEYYGVELYNTSTRERVSVTLDCIETVYALDRKYQPYGLFVDELRSSGSTKEYLLLAVDAISYKFLSYVDKLTFVMVHRGSKEHEVLSKAEDWYRAIDKNKSVFAQSYLNGDDQCVMTLFNVAKSLWLNAVIDNRLYIRKSRRRMYEEYEQEDMDVFGGMTALPQGYELDAWCVYFNDIQAAGRLITKYGVVGGGK